MRCLIDKKNYFRWHWNLAFKSIFFRFDTYWLPVSKSLQRLQSFLINNVMHMKSFVTFVQARLDSAIHLSDHF